MIPFIARTDLRVLVCVATVFLGFQFCCVRGNAEDVRPILSNHCFACHGPDEQHREADLRLDMESEFDADEIIRRIESDDPDEVMPPPETKKPLSPEQVEALRRWAKDGARIEQHWSFVPIENPTVPDLENNQWSNHSIDRFVLAKLRENQREPNGEADKRTLIRRLCLDLTGLPPSQIDVETFLDDQAPDAYERLVDRLLRRPEFGEHMARYWLDLVRFADTNGLHHDHYREMSPFRDWVIRAFNDNLSFDDFVRYQIAGDLYPEPSEDQLIASGFNRLHLIIDRGTALPEESFMRNVVDRVTAVGTAFMGLTVQCSVCHDHKYDPITQRDFYSLYAFFNNFDGEPETGGRRGSDFKRGLQPPYIEFPTEEQKEELASLDALLKKNRETIKEMELMLEQLSATFGPKHPKSVQEKSKLDIVKDTLKGLEARRERVIESIPATLVMKERSENRPAHIMVRGQYDQPGEVVERATPAFLPPMNVEGEIPTRMDLANWLVSPQHPLTARVTVNRFWQYLFGVGLVKTSEDLGAQGESPSHPELLDHLSGQFVRSGWNVKSLVKSMVLSKTYRQSSVAAKEHYLADPRNRLLSRGSRFRLDAEVIRDQVLALTGVLNTRMHGKSVKPPQPEGLWQIVAMPSSYPRVFKPDEGDEIYRRSVYTFWKRGLPPPQMTILDAPTRESCIARRERTNTPLASLLLMNEPQYFSAAIHLAEKSVSDEKSSEGERIAQLYRRVTCQIPSEDMHEKLIAFLHDMREHYQDNPELAETMISHSSDERIKHCDDKPELAAWSMLVHSLLNLDITKTRQ